MRTRCLTALLLVLAATRAEAAATAWVSNEKDNTISVIDVGTQQVVARSPWAGGRAAWCSRPTYATLYICASDSDAVQVLDVATRKIVGDLPSGADPEFFDLDPTGAISTSPTRTMRSPPWSTRQAGRSWRRSMSGSSPRAWPTSHDGRWAVTTSETTNMVHWIDTTTTRWSTARWSASGRAIARFTADDSCCG